MAILVEEGPTRVERDGAGGNGKDGAGRLGALREGLLHGEQNVSNVERVASVVAGGALIALAFRRGGIGGALLGMAATSLLHRGATGHCVVYGSLGLSTAEESGFLERQHGDAAVLNASKAIKVEHAVTVAKDRETLYAFWRDLSNLPRIMRHLEDVTVLDDRRSLWTAKAPLGQKVQWEAEIHNEVPGQLIAWRSVDEATVPNAGSVHFRDAGEGRTEVRVVLEYSPPAGQLGHLVAKALGEEPGHQVREDLESFRVAMESRYPG